MTGGLVGRRVMNQRTGCPEVGQPAVFWPHVAAADAITSLGETRPRGRCIGYPCASSFVPLF